MKRHDERLTYGRTCVYNLNYHIVWGTKYRNKVLNRDIENELKQMLYDIAAEKGFSITHLEIGTDDHVHLLGSAKAFCDDDRQLFEGYIRLSSVSKTS